MAPKRSIHLPSGWIKSPYDRIQVRISHTGSGRQITEVAEAWAVQYLLDQLDNKEFLLIYLRKTEAEVTFDPELPAPAP